MTNKLEIGRELLERMRQRLIDLGQIDDFGPELFQLLNCAAPVVERQYKDIDCENCPTCAALVPPNSDCKYCAPVVERQDAQVCATCDGKRIVDDGELTHSSGANGDLIADLTAIIAQQAQRIAHLDRGRGETVAYKSYTTQPAESLAGMAARQLKDEKRWIEIRDANALEFPDMSPHDYYPVGSIIRIPCAEQPAPVAVVSVAEAWEACGGNPGINASRDELLSALKLMNEAEEDGAVLPSREVMRDIIAEAIGGDTYDCTRVWSAWGVGTMSEDDFVPLIEQDDRLYEIVDACLDKVKELNQ